MKNRKIFLYSAGLLLAIVVLFYFLGEVILPFIIGLIAAFMANPIVKWIQKFIPNRNLAVTTFLTSSAIVLGGILFIFGSEIVNDAKRLNRAFEIFADDHHEQIDETNEVIKTYLQKIYNSEEVQQTIHPNEAQQDSLKTTAFDHAGDAFSAITSFIGSADEGNIESSKTSTGLNWIGIFLGSIIYFLYIIFTFDYFEKKYEKYFDADLKKNSFIRNFVEDFRRIFLEYFRKRTEVVAFCFLIFLTAFLIINVPGAIYLALLAAVLCYIPHFHYITLIPLSLSCWVLSMESGIGFFVFFSIIGGVFILVSILEELLFTPKIMKKYNGLNPAIMIVSFAIWSHLFGVVFGTLIALPMTSIVLIYLDQLLLHTKKVLIEKSKEE